MNLSIFASLTKDKSGGHLRNAIRMLKQVAFISNPLINLRDVLSMSDVDKGKDLATNYFPMFIDFLETYSPELIENINIDEHEEIYGTELENLPDEVYMRFLETRGMEVSDDPYAPPYLSMDFIEIVQNQWLIHFTDDAASVAINGFTVGVPEYDYAGLAYSTRFKETYKTGGYNFAFDLRDYERYGKEGSGWKYGDEAVIFKASGVKALHYGDQEPQVIFMGPSATDIVPIIKSEGEYYPGFGLESGEYPYRDENLDNVIAWVTENFGQYRDYLIYK